MSLSGFEWVEDLSKFNVDFIKSYNEQSSEGYFLEVDVQYPENLHETHNNLPFLPKIKKVDKVNKVVVNCKIKKEYIIHIRNLIEQLNHWLVLQKTQNVMKINQKAWLKSILVWIWN